MDYDFPYIGNVIIPTDELIFIRGVGYTTNKDNKDEDMINLNTDRWIWHYPKIGKNKQ